MAYLTFSEYTELGGTIADESVFTNLERKAERKLDYFTQDRLKTATVIVGEVKELLVEFVDRIQNSPLNGNVTSYSNGIESFGFEKNQIQAFENELHDLAVEYLPIELITSYVTTASEV